MSTGSSTLVKKTNPSTCSTPKSTRNLRTCSRFRRQFLVSLPLKCFKCRLFQGIPCFSYLDLLRRDPPKLMTGRFFHDFFLPGLYPSTVASTRCLCDSFVTQTRIQALPSAEQGFNSHHVSWHIIDTEAVGLAVAKAWTKLVLLGRIWDSWIGAKKNSMRAQNAKESNH